MYYCLSCCGGCGDDDGDDGIDQLPRHGTRYEQIIIGSDDDDDGGGEYESGWTLDLLGSLSSSGDDGSGSGDDDEELSVERIMDEENSIDDTEYYRLYMPRSHTRPYRQPKRESARTTSTCIAKARNKATACLDATTRMDYDEIISAYEEAFKYCPERHKPCLVREYETFKAVYITFSCNTDDYKKAERVAHECWKQASLLDHTLTRRQSFYRRALMCMPHAQTKARWKKEYNQFYNTQCV